MRNYHGPSSSSPGQEPGEVGMDAVYPASASALARGRRLRRQEPRLRHRTMPVTFAEIKEVDEESEGVGVGVGSEANLERRRRPDVLEERLGRQFAEFRFRRRAKHALRELSPPPPAPASASAPGVPRASSEPAALDRPPEPGPAAAAGT